MLTGDSLLTSLHVAREVGIVDTNRPCLVLKSDTNGLLTTLQSITDHFQTLERGGSVLFVRFYNFNSFETIFVEFLKTDKNG